MRVCSCGVHACMRACVFESACRLRTERIQTEANNLLNSL